MKVLLVHNAYQEPGGEDAVFAAEAALLESKGWEVGRYTLHNDAINDMGAVSAACRTFWNQRSAAEIRDLVVSKRPRVVHFHNTFPLVSPAAYYAARSAGAAVVQTLHNYRLVCPGSLLMRGSGACEDCVGKTFAWPSVMHGCYRGSTAATAVVAAMVGGHRIGGTWRRAVDRYIALSNFSSGRFVAGGLPKEKIAVKGNFVYPEPPPPDGSMRDGGDHVLYVGRLSHEKGIQVLLDAWRGLETAARLTIVGDGPLRGSVEAFAAGRDDVSVEGPKPKEEVLGLMRRANLLVLPSICYENFPMTVAEAFAVGTPVAASRIGALAEIVRHGRTGFLFEPGDPASLARVIELSADDPELMRQMGANARAQYEAHYTAEGNYRRLMDVYDEALVHAAARIDARAASRPVKAQTRAGKDARSGVDLGSG